MSSPDEDDDRTVIRPRTSPAAPVAPDPVAPAAHPASGTAEAATVRMDKEREESNALPVGTRIDEFEIKGVIGVGGFSIVYLAHDHSLRRDVAFKEYLPTSLAARMGGVQVAARTQRHADTFAAGLASFINEARLLAQFDSPSLVKVYRFWNANGTAYMVMPFYEGPTLKQALLAMPAAPDEAWLKTLLAPLLSAIDLLHRENCFHRDIAPDNILLLKGERPVLLDFGAARHVIEDQAKTLTVILKPGFAPVEQYADTPGMKQGAYTDIYALAAVVHHAIMGRAPTPSVSRLVRDDMVPLAKAALGRYSGEFLAGIDRALAVRPEERPRDIAAFRAAIGLGEGSLHGTGQSLAPRPANTAGSKRNKLLWLALAGLAVVGVVAGVALLGPGGETLPAKTVPVPVPVAASPAPPANPVTPVVPAPVAAGLGLRAPTDLSDALAELFELRDRNQVVAVNMPSARVRIHKDRIRFQIQADVPGYLYIFMVGTADKDNVVLLFPNALDGKNAIASGQSLALPRASWPLTASGPAGVDQFVAIVSATPRDFSNVGIKRAGPFAEMPKDKVLAAMRERKGAAAALSGVPACKPDLPCPAGYGAVSFSLEEVGQ